MLVCFTLFTAISYGQTDASINQLVDTWHQAAANANFNLYFSLMSADAVFVGTDPTEHWDVTAFKAFAKPYFEKGKAWDFKPLKRHVYFSSDKKTAWFDELLNTWMKICRGSGVLKKEKDEWKITHYVLSIAIPNKHTDSVVSIKKDFDNIEIEKLLKK